MTDSTSPQMVALLASYGVSTERDLLRAIIREAKVETGYRMTRNVAEATLDRMLEATYQRLAGEATEVEPVDERCACEVSQVYGGDCAHTVEPEPVAVQCSLETPHGLHDFNADAYCAGVTPFPTLQHSFEIGPYDPRDLPF